MSELLITRHAEARMRQRGFRDADISMVLTTATQVAGDAYFLSDQDVDREVRQRKREIQQLERLRGTRAVIVGGSLITVYQLNRKAAQASRGKPWRVS